MALSQRATSRFAISRPIMTRAGDPTFGIATKHRFLDRSRLSEDDIDVRVVKSREAGRPDRLAENIYGDANLHWILILFNRVENPLNWPLNGQIIEYPSRSMVSAEI